MSAVPSLSTILSLLSFLTTVFALARVGAAAFSANNPQTGRDSPESPGAERTTTWSAYTRAAQPAAHLLQLQLGGPGPGSVTGSEMSFAQAIRFGLSLEGGKDKDAKDRKGEKEKTVGYIGGHDLVRMPASTWTGTRRPGLLFRPHETVIYGEAHHVPTPKPKKIEPPTNCASTAWTAFVAIFALSID